MASFKISNQEVFNLWHYTYKWTDRFFDKGKLKKKNFKLKKKFEKNKKLKIKNYVVRRRMFQNIIRIKHEQNRTSRSKDRTLLNLKKRPPNSPKKISIELGGHFFYIFRVFVKKIWDHSDQYFSSYAQKVIFTLNLYVFGETQVYHWPVPYSNTFRHPGRQTM